ncbi:50S ribosomal protein L24 [Clostridiales bacterium PH28_bin88]|nr:50S ribosomal protein L24 [Clostridiales bacterium PH28_bin88]
MHVKKGDTVVVIAGKSIGKKGKVLEVNPDKGTVIVEGANIVKRHTKPTQKAPQGGIMEKESPLAGSNVMVYCNRCNNPTRVGRKYLEDGSKVRYCKKCGEVLDK